MKTPADKIHPNARWQNDIIQIIVTTNCDILYCSNCTQLLPYRQDPRFMSPRTFREALRSLEGWPGVRAMFGGNPCVHPQFEELCAIMREEVPDQRQRGLWTNHLRGHGPIIRETFYPQGRFNLNIHCVEAAKVEMETYLPGIPIYGQGRPSRHAPILMAYQDLGIPEADWVEMREGCDINQRWSAAIAERAGIPYAYFCEVGAALDGIRGENHGVPAVPGWWRWPIEAFQHQITGCCDAGCGVPLRMAGHLDQDETYDATAHWVEYMRSKARPAIAVHETPQAIIPEVTDYQRFRS